MPSSARQSADCVHQRQRTADEGFGVGVVLVSGDHRSRLKKPDRSPPRGWFVVGADDLDRLVLRLDRVEFFAIDDVVLVNA